MAVHKSIEHFYKDLYDLNPVVSGFEQIFSDYGRSHTTAKEIERDLCISVSSEQQSLLFQGFSKSLKYDNHKPTSIVTHRYIFAVGVNDRERAYIVYYESEDISLKSCHFYENFFYHPPQDVIKVNGRLNNFESMIKKHGIWSTGDCCFSLGQIIKFLMRKEISFQDMPKESLLFIEETVAPIEDKDHALILDLIKKDKAKIIQLQTSVNGALDDIKNSLVEKLNTMQRNNEILQKMLLKHGSLDSLKKEMDNYSTKILAFELEKEKLKLAEEKAKLEEHRAKIDEQQANLEKKIVDVDDKLRAINN